MQPLKALRRFSRRLPCYLCGSRLGINADHAAPQRWVYKGAEPPQGWPTVPICERCKVATDPADNELQRCVAIMAGSQSPLWPAFRDALNRAGPLLRDTLRRTATAWDGQSQQTRGYWTYDKQLVQLAVEKLARGLTWILGDEMQPPGSDYAWDLRVGHEFAFDGPFSIRQYEFGPRFRCSVGDLRVGRRWHITYADRVHLAISYFQPEKLKTLATAAAFYLTRPPK